MSANNWATCPRCLAEAEKTKTALAAEAAAAYGKVPEDEYAQMREQSREDITLDSTMREDYELGVNMLGEFRLSFSASCGTCGYRFEFETTEQTKI